MKDKKYTHIIHGFEPVYDQNSKILILGTLPSVKSRETAFYYGHPQNRFWRLLAAVYGGSVPSDKDEKTAFLLSHNIALWDVIAECDIIGSSDSSIKNAVPTDISKILETADIKLIIANGAAAMRLYEKYQRPACGRAAVQLPSTSPANAVWSLEKLAEKWGPYLRLELIS